MHKRRTLGFTLIELTVTTGIASVLAAAAVPSFADMIARQRLSLTINEMTLALELARNEATTTGVRSVVAARDGANWASGWRVFRDDNDNGRLDDGETVVREFGAPAPSISFATHFGAGVSGVRLSYDDTGFIRRPGSNGLVMGRVVVTQGAENRVLCFGATRVRLAKGTLCS
jgi:type IV fimbrial biogenesis protein FimT